MKNLRVVGSDFEEIGVENNSDVQSIGFKEKFIKYLVKFP